MKSYVLAALLLVGTGAQAQQTIDPPMTQQELQALAHLQKEYKKGGLPPLTPEQEVQIIVKMRAKTAEMLGNALAAQQNAQYLSNMDAKQKQALAASYLAQHSNAAAATGMGATVPVPTAAPALVGMDPGTLARNIAEHDKSAAFTRFEPRRDGFLYNGKPIVDAAGEIGDYGGDTNTGAVSYLVQVAPDRWLLKYRNVNSALPPLVLGQVVGQGDTVTLQTVTGESSTGANVLPTSRGALIFRGGSLVTFDAKAGLTAAAIPEGFSVAELQHGDVAGTGFVLLERDAAPDRSSTQSPLEALKKAKAGLISAFKNDAYDYALFNPATGMTVPLNMSVNGNKATFMSGCKRQNDVVNRCSNAARHASLWDQDGQPNNTHYYWSLNWFNTTHGPMAVAREGGTSDISVFQLASGTRVVAFHRGLGVGIWSVEPTENGSARLKASWPFIKQPVIEDIASVFESGFTTVQ